LESTSPNSNDKNIEIVSMDVMIEVQTPAPLLVCEFIMTLQFYLSKKILTIGITSLKKNNWNQFNKSFFCTKVEFFQF